MTDTPDQTGSQTPSSGAESSPPAAPAPAKADLGKRAIAMIIDAVATMIVGFIPLIGGVIATAYWLLRDGMDVEFMDHRSLGKKLMKLRPVTLDGSPVDMATSAKRNWMFAIGGIAMFFTMTLPFIGLVVAIPLFLLGFVLWIVEIVLVLTDAEGRRIGDKTAETRVIETDT